METPKPPRKCYLRKIKCDRQRPRCSSCITNDTDCTYAAPSRPSRPRVRKRPAASSSNETDPGIANLHAFVERLQAQVSELTQRLDDAKDNQAGVQHQRHDQSPPAPEISARTTPPTIAVDAIGSDDTDTPISSSDFASITLPPLHEVKAVVRVFLDTFNAVMPLFEPMALLKLVDDWYAAPHHRDPTPWAAINVVLALTYWQNLPSSSGPADGQSLAAVHLNKAQSVISAVILGDTTLLSIQVLLGVTILLQASKNRKPSLVLIATAIRLAHELGLHTRAATTHLDPVVARQSSYVFWIAYILDKDISMRARQPSIQRDEDIDIDVPIPTVTHDLSSALLGQAGDDVLSDGLGVVTTLSGNAKTDYFLARVRLATIQGGIHDYLYSTQSQNRTPSERAISLESLVQALQDWKRSIPPEFSATQAPETLSAASLPFFCVLHATSFACITMINQADAWNEQWVQSLRNSCRQAVQLRLPSHWKLMVHDAREFLTLFETFPPRNYGLIWETTCAYLTAATVLAANNASQPLHDEVPADLGSINNAVIFMNDLTSRGLYANQQLQIVRSACVELNQSALSKREEAIPMG